MLLGAEFNNEMTLCLNTPTKIITNKMGMRTQSRMALSRNSDCSTAMISRLAWGNLRYGVMVLMCDEGWLEDCTWLDRVCAWQLRASNFGAVLERGGEV